MPFPSEKKLKKVRAKLVGTKGTRLLASNATPLEQLRWDICQKFIKYKAKHNLSQEELARVLGVDKAKVSKILHHRIAEFSTDRLLKLCQELEPNLKIKLS